MAKAACWTTTDAEVSVSLAKDGIREIKTNQKDIRKALKQALREQRKVTRQKYDSPLEAARAKAEASKALVFQRTQLSLSNCGEETPKSASIISNFLLFSTSCNAVL